MIRSFLDVSGGHLSPETWAWLDRNLAEDILRDPWSAGGIAGGKTRHGWFVYAPEEAMDDYPQDLQRVLAEARRHGAEYVLIDTDVIPNLDLPVLHPDFAAD